MRNRLPRLVALVALFSFGVAPAWAQMGTGRVSGSLKDTQGNPIKDAKVSAIGPAGKPLEATTDDKGRWALLGFRSGTYEFAAEATGFQAYNWKVPVKQTGRNAPMEIVLEPAAAGKASSVSSGLLEEGSALYDAKDYPAAIAKFEELAAEEPTFYQVNLFIGGAYLAMKESTKARDYYQKVLEQDPLHTDALVKVGDTYIEENDFDNAVLYFEKAVEQTAAPEVPYMIGEIYFNRGEAAKAVDYYKRAAELKVDWADPHLRMGYAYLNSADIESAKLAFAKVVEIAPDSGQAQAAQAALDSLPQ